MGVVVIVANKPLSNACARMKAAGVYDCGFSPVQSHIWYWTQSCREQECLNICLAVVLICTDGSPDKKEAPDVNRDVIP